MQTKYGISTKDKVEFRDKNVVYRSNIQEVEENVIGIDVPVAVNKYYTMHKGMEVEYLIISNNEAYKCKSTVVGRKKDGEVILILLSYPKILGKVQRREFFRLPTCMDIKCSPIPKEVEYTNASQVSDAYISKMTNASALDISGGGIRIITKEKYDNNVQVVLQLDLNENLYILGRVLRVEYDSQCRNYKIGIRFEGNEVQTIEKVVKYIFVRSREKIKYS